MVETYRLEREPEKPKEVKKFSKGFLFLLIILLLLASSLWGLALNANWRQTLYASFKEASLPTPIEIKEEAYQPPKELTIICLDVGQALGHIILIPSGKVIMFDAGEGGDPDYKYTKYYNSGEKAYLPVLRGEHIKRIDSIVGSHPHSDHMGGIVPLVQGDEFEIGEFVESGMAFPTTTYKAILAALDKKKEIKYRIVGGGDILDWGPDVFVQVLSPPRDAPLWSGANDNSVTIMLTYGKTRFLFPGDIEKNAIDKLISNYGPRLRADFIQVPHHGSNTSNDRNFIALVHPSIAVTSATGGEPFGLPTPETTKRYKEIGTQIYHTHLNGNITITSDGEHIEVKTLR